MSPIGVKSPLVLVCCLAIAAVSLPPLWAAADLVVEPADIEVTPRLPAPGVPDQPFPILVERGKPVRFRATIANRGDRAAVATYAEIDVSRYPVGSGQEPVWVGVIAPLSVGAGKRVTLPFTPGRHQAPAFVPQQNGVYIAVVHVDPESAVQENHGNNLAGIPLQVVPPAANGPRPTLALPDLICAEPEQLLATTADEPSTHHREVAMGQQVKFLVSCRLEGAGPYSGYVEVEVNRRGAKPGDPPVWHGVFAFVDLKEGATARGLARARSQDGLPEFWTPGQPGEYIVGLVADPGHKSDDLGRYLPRGDLLELPGKDTFYGKETGDDAARRYGNNAVFHAVTVRP